MMLDPEAHHKLREMVNRNNSIIRDQRRCENLLKDYFPNHREAEVLAIALRQGVPVALIERPTYLSGNHFAKHIQRRLQDDCGLEQSAAEWAVSTWAAALAVDVTPSADPPSEEMETGHATPGIGSMTVVVAQETPFELALEVGLSQIEALTKSFWRMA